jgi:photosystem II stability/assembly factor-like uncharacterized protein
MNRLIIIISLLFLVGTGWSDWQSIGPDGGNIMAIAIDAQNPSVLYAVPYEYPENPRVFKTTNGGMNWQQINRISDNYVMFLAVDEHQSNILYGLGRSNNLHRSTDFGINWTNVSLPGNGGEIEIDPLIPGKLYIPGSYNLQVALLISTDYGLNWTPSVLDTFRGSANCCAVGPIDTGTIYLGSAYSRLFRSTDGGSNWELRNTGISPNVSIQSLSINPVNSDMILAGTSGGMFRTTNAGESWSLVSTFNMVFEVEFAKSTSNIAYAIGYQESAHFYVSTDSGITWTIPDSLFRLDKGAGLLTDPSNGAVVYINTMKGVFKTEDFGSLWQTAHNNIRIAKISTIIVSPWDNRRVYLEAYENGVFKSNSTGDTWTRCEDFLSCGNICGIGLGPATGTDVQYALEGSG